MADVRVAEVSGRRWGRRYCRGRAFPAAVAKPGYEDLGVVDEAGDRSADIPSAEIGGRHQPKNVLHDKAGDSVTEVEPAGDQLAEVLDARDSRASRGEVARLCCPRCQRPTRPTRAGVEEIPGWSSSSRIRAAGIDEVES